MRMTPEERVHRMREIIQIAREKYGQMVKDMRAREAREGPAGEPS